jgi:hypothetical protein
MKKYIDDFIFISGVAMAAIGLYLVFKPLAYLFVGFTFMFVGVMLSRRR